MIVKPNDSHSVAFKRKTVRGFSLLLKAQAAANNTALNMADFNLDIITIKITLNRFGKEYIICSDKMGPLVRETMFQNGLFNLVNASASSATPKVLRAHGVSEKALVLLPFEIDFRGVVNLRDGDELEIAVEMPSSAFSADVDTNATSLQIDEIEAIGYEVMTPRISVSSVRQSETRLTLPLGDNVIGIVFLNIDKTGITDANRVIESVQIESDRYKLNDNYYALLQKRYMQFEVDDIADEREQSFNLFDARLPMFSGEELDKCTLDLTLNSGNVTASKNFVVTRSYYADGRLVELAGVSRNLHSEQKLRKLGLQSTVNVANLSKYKNNLLKRIKG